MKILLSPAKSQDFSSTWTTALAPTQPKHLSTAAELIKTLSKLSVTQLEKTLGVSAKLAKQNHQSFQSWTKTHSKNTAKPAILAYTGDVYQQLSAALYTKHQQQYTQESLRIISGLYGCLRPYDLIRPYRLEMKTVLEHDGKRQAMSDFWKDVLTKQIQAELAKDPEPLLINLSSQEYSAAIDFERIDHPHYSIVFQQIRDGKKPKVIGILAKRARGQMLEYLIRRGATSLDMVREFSAYGYALTAEADHQLVFTTEQV